MTSPNLLCSLTGTARYASLNTHLGIEQARRDDLESLGYVFVYFLKGSLPWQGLKANTKRQKYEKILEKKARTSVDVLCQNLPAEFKSYFEHVKSVKFEDRPDYDYLKRLFRELFFRKGHTYDNIFDWESPQSSAGSSGAVIARDLSSSHNINNGGGGGGVGVGGNKTDDKEESFANGSSNRSAGM